VKDQYRYFRIEARELLGALNESVLAVEKGDRKPETVGKILRCAHTLKGAARIVKQAGIAEYAHSLEEAFAALRDARAEVTNELINAALRSLDEIASAVGQLEGDSPKPRAAAPETFETVRVEVDEVDALLEAISEASVELSTLRHEAALIKEARTLAGTLSENLMRETLLDPSTPAQGGMNFRMRAVADDLRRALERLERSFSVEMDQVEAEFSQIYDAANRLRLLSVATLRGTLELAVRDAAQSLAKQVRFDFSGDDIRLDTQVLAGLGKALLHAVRNAVAHGIEAPADRRAAGKPEQGSIELRVERRAEKAVFTCADDGGGIDVNAVRDSAQARGLISAGNAASLRQEDAIEILLRGGLTTTGAVDEISGRGIGLDVIRETVARLKGAVRISSTPGRGTSLEISVPVSIASLTALEMSAGDAVVAVPIDAVRQTLRVSGEEIVRSADCESVIYDGKAIPFSWLSDVLEQRRSQQPARFCSAVILKAPTGTAAIGVERLLGATNIVVRPLPSFVPAATVISGTSLDREGNPRLVLDPERLVGLVKRGVAVMPAEAGVERPPILVIDDSLTTRMLEQSILESAGYEVELATSAEEGLEKARAGRYGLFLVDVEMPGIDGFEFVARTKADPGLQEIPAILITSRASNEDRRRGVQVGARGYVVKGEFDQGHLLALIREFIG
jgi:two-component system chemotaxis sensor kinase CheA